MNCPKCNAVLSPNAKFCVRCGAKVAAEAGAGTQAQQNKGTCIKCGAPLSAAAKFCVVCGSSQSVQPTQNVLPSMQASRSAAGQSVQTPVQQAPVQQTPVQQAPVQQTPVQQAPKKKKKSKLPLVMIIIVLIIVLLVGGCFALESFSGFKPITMIKEYIESLKDSDEDKDSDKDKDGDKDKDSDKDKDDDDTPEGQEGSNSGFKEGEEEKKIDPKVLEDLSAQLKTAKEAYDGTQYEDAANKCINIVDQYLALGKEYTLDEDAVGQIAEAYDLAERSAIASCKALDGQGFGNGLYKQLHYWLDPVFKLAAKLTENGYEVDSAEITEYSDSIVQNFRVDAINKINEITEREQWSRDEAWTYANNAYEIQENGKAILFDENDPDDPLRLRYGYCLAWIMGKRCENGVAQGSMTNQDAYDALMSVLEETDYNLLVIKDIIKYGGEIGKDTSRYQAAYSAIIQKVKEEQNLSILENSAVTSSTSVDVRKFWYFNDLDGDDAYKVDINNGTTKATRDWIRKNIPSYFE